MTDRQLNIHSGVFKSQILPITAADGKSLVTTDEGVRFPVDTAKVILFHDYVCVCVFVYICVCLRERETVDMCFIEISWLCSSDQTR